MRLQLTRFLVIIILLQNLPLVVKIPGVKSKAKNRPVERLVAAHPIITGSQKSLGMKYCAESLNNHVQLLEEEMGLVIITRLLGNFVSQFLTIIIFLDPQHQ